MTVSDLFLEECPISDTFIHIIMNDFIFDNLIIFTHYLDIDDVSSFLPIYAIL